MPSPPPGHDLFRHPLGVVVVVLDLLEGGDGYRTPGYTLFLQPAQAVDDLLFGHAGSRPGIIPDLVTLTHALGAEAIEDVYQAAVVVRL